MTNTRSKWPTAQHLQQAATEIRQAAAGMPPELQNFPDPVADWLDKTALDMAWLAPFRPHEIGHLPWQIATRIAHGILNLPDADTCAICHTQDDRTEAPQ